MAATGAPRPARKPAQVDTKSSEVTVEVSQKDDPKLFDVLMGKKDSPSLIDILAGKRDIVLHVTFTNPDQKWEIPTLGRLIGEKAFMTAERR